MLNRYLLAPLAALLLAAAPRLAHAQTPTGSVGIGTTAPDASAALEVSSTSKGLLPPRLSQALRDAIASPAAGLTIYNTSTGKLNTWNGTSWDAALSATEQPSLTGPSQTFIYTGGVQYYTVPAGVTLLDVDARGSCGNFGSSGGAGGRVQTTLTVVPGEVLTIYAGGYTGGAGFNGGGRNGSGGVGGGATDLRRAPATLADRLVVAGGGGGSTRNGAPGGAGGGLTGGPGGYDGGIPGGGGSQTAGGSAGGNAASGSLGQGGAGDSGGGSGYYGGGGGYVSAGGGGSSYVVPTGSRNTTYTQGFNRSDGSITLTVVALTYAAPVLDGRNFINVPGDNLGNHTATQALNLGTNPLTGNGGTTGLTISSAGNATVAGNVQVPAANAYRYAAAKSYSVTYGISDLQLEQEGSAAKQRTVVGGAEYAYTTQSMSLRIPLHLPNGATVTGITLYGQDSDAGQNLTGVFISVLPTATGLSAPGYTDGASSSGTPGYTTVTITPAVGTRVIDNDRAYYVLVDAKSANCLIGAVRVSYTVTQAE